METTRDRSIPTGSNKSGRNPGTESSVGATGSLSSPQGAQRGIATSRTGGQDYDPNSTSSLRSRTSLDRSGGGRYDFDAPVAVRDRTHSPHRPPPPSTAVGASGPVPSASGSGGFDFASLSPQAAAADESPRRSIGSIGSGSIAAAVASAAPSLSLDIPEFRSYGYGYVTRSMAGHPSGGVLTTATTPSSSPGIGGGPSRCAVDLQPFEPLVTSGPYLSSGSGGGGGGRSGLWANSTELSFTEFISGDAKPKPLLTPLPQERPKSLPTPLPQEQPNPKPTPPLPPAVPSQGASPAGTMTLQTSPEACPGFPLGTTVLEIHYNLPEGIQLPIHPYPGIPYRGTHRVAYLPESDAGRKLLRRLQWAFVRGLTFAIGYSQTHNVSDAIVWTGLVDHKTSLCGGGPYGYPDNNYLTNCNQQLDRHGIPNASDCQATLGNPTTVNCQPQSLSDNPAEVAGWDTPQPPDVGYHHFLEYHHAKVPATVPLLDLARSIQVCLGRLSLQTEYVDNPMAVHGTTLKKDCRITVSIWRDDGITSRDDDNILEAEDMDYDFLDDYDKYLEMVEAECTMGGDTRTSSRLGSSSRIIAPPPKPHWLVEIHHRMGDSYAYNLLARDIVRVVKAAASASDIGGEDLPTDATATAFTASQPTSSPSTQHPGLLTAQQQEQVRSRTEKLLSVISPATGGTGTEASDPHGVGQSSRDVLALSARLLDGPSRREVRSGLELLGHATDLSTTVPSAVRMAAVAVLLGLGFDRAEFLQRTVIRLLLAPQLASAEGNAEAAAEQAHLALMIVANALLALKAGEITQFVEFCFSEFGVDVLQHWSDGVRRARLDLGRAFYCLLALKAVCERVPDYRTRVQLDVIRDAHSVGQNRPQAAVEQASRRLLAILNAGL